MNGEVRAVCFPPDDDTFVAHVQRLVQAPISVEPLQAAIESLLRETYPLAVIAPRQAMASVDGQRTWYVYRDGASAPRDRSPHARQVGQTLTRWRAAEIAWHTTSGRDWASQEDARRSVVRAWIEYQEAVATDPDEVLLVVDRARCYVGVSSNVERILGYGPEVLTGRTIESIAHPVPHEATELAFQRFLEEGHQEGIYSLVCADGRVVQFDFEARAHRPIHGYHVSRLRPVR